MRKGPHPEKRTDGWRKRTTDLQRRSEKISRASRKKVEGGKRGEGEKKVRRMSRKRDGRGKTGGGPAHMAKGGGAPHANLQVSADKQDSDQPGRWGKVGAVLRVEPT